jgi:hypothetical protein
MSNPACEPNDPRQSVETRFPAKVSTSVGVPAEIRTLLGEPPLLATEDPNHYYALLAELAREVKPKDVIEWLWVKDTADLSWEILRYRRIKAAHVNGLFTSALTRLVHPVPSNRHVPLMSFTEKLKAYREKDASARGEPNRLASEWATDATSREQVDAGLKAQGLDADSIMSESFVDAIGNVSAIDRLLASAEHRRNMALREIERRRFLVGHALRQTSDQIIEDEAPLVPATD